jgi:hypothetical protein
MWVQQLLYFAKCGIVLKSPPIQVSAGTAAPQPSMCIFNRKVQVPKFVTLWGLIVCLTGTGSGLTSLNAL